MTAVHVLKNIGHDHVRTFNCRDRDDVGVFDRRAIAVAIQAARNCHAIPQIWVYGNASILEWLR
jgi:hypothetical protein